MNYLRISSLLTLLLPLSLNACNQSEAKGHEAPLSLPPAASASSAAAPTEHHAADGTLTLSGTAAPARVSQLAVNAAGIIRHIKVREGDRVKKNQVLCILDATTSSLRTQAARNQQQQAQAALADAQRDLARAEKLAASGALPEATLEKARLGLKIATLRAQGARVGLHMAGSALADSRLRAPFPGVITKVIAEEGQYVSFMPPAPVFILADLDTLKLTVPVPERYIRFVHKGSAVKVWLKAVDVHRDAVVSRMAEVVDPMTRSAEAVILLDNKDHKLPGGLFASVSFPGVSEDTSAGGSREAASASPSSSASHAAKTSSGKGK